MSAENAPVIRFTSGHEPAILSPDMVQDTRIQQLLTELKTGLQEIYGPRLRGFYLFGSYARGEQEPESDVDVLIVLDDFTNYCEEIKRSGYLASQLSLKYNVSVSRVFMRESEWLHRDSPFLLNVREEAVAA